MSTSLRPVLNSAPELRKNVHEKVTDALKGLFPIDLKGRTLEVKDITVHAQDYSTEEQKHALLTGSSLTEPIKGTLVLKGTDGQVLDEAKNFTLLKLPYFTERHTLITDGNEYQVANMLRRKPGVYTQRSQNGELSTLFNLSKGKNFHMTMVPETGVVHMEYDTSKIPLYPVLRALGVPHADIANHLGAGVADANKALHGHQEESAIHKLYTKLVHPGVQKTTDTHEQKIQAVAAKYEQTGMNGDVTLHTLGTQHEKVTTKALLDAAQKLLRVHEGKKEIDDSDSLAFKTFHSVDDFLAERLKLFGRAWTQKTKLRFTGKEKIRDALSPQPFTDTVKRFVNSSTLAAVPMGINPIELIDHAVKVTSLGEGGISSDRAIPYESRLVHNTHYGVIDPIRTPEASTAGVDVRITISAQRDQQGNLYTPVKNLKTGKIEYISAGDQNKHIIAFPHQELKGKVDAFVHGKIDSISAKDLTHQYIHNGQAYSPATSLVPFLHNIQGNRAIMGSKMQTQALPLVEREAPLVQVKSHKGDESYEKLYAKLIVPTSPVDGVITKIENGRIYIKPNDESIAQTHAEHSITKISAASTEVKVHYQTDFPFPSKTYLNHDLHVKVGDKVSAGQTLAGSNFTKDDTLALGKNLRVAYMAYHGLNSNDAVVISEGAAKKLTSEHMYREVYPIGLKVELNKEKHRIYFGTKYSPAQYENLDENGIVKKGSKVDPYDLLVAGFAKTELSAVDLMLGRISKSLTKPFKDNALVWGHGVQGTIVEVVKTNTQIAILIKTLESMQIGDKLSGRHGNKGVISKVIPDHEMIQDESGKPIDVILTSAGVVSRINPGQIIESAVGKVAEKLGKPIVIDNAATHDTVEWASNLLKKHGIKDKENVYDPITKKTITGPDGKGVFVGRSYIFKLFKSTDTNFSAHGVGPYDINEQPSKMGGEESPKGIAKMEFDALVAHNARNILKESSTIRSQKNEEFWKALQLGHPQPVAKPSFVWNKFTSLLEGAGIKVDKRGSKIKLLPMTDKDILEKSHGEIETNKTLIAKNMQPEKGGLFDPNATGGPQGTKYSHIKLHEALPNPVFEEPIRRLLGMTQVQFDKTLKEKGGEHFKSELEKIDVDAKLKKLREEIKLKKGSVLNDCVKQIKYLEALKEEKLKPQDAYILNHVPVIPPVFRPILPMPNDPKQLMVSDANKLYMHLMDANHTLKTTVLDSDRPTHRNELYSSLGAVFGTHEVEDDELKGQKVKGFLSGIAGVGSPKAGFFQRKIMRRTMDVSGRGTAVPDVNLNMDEVGLPEDMLWGMYDPFIMARLVRQGYPAIQAKEMVEKRNALAKNALLMECKERPVYLNRAPTLHRWSIVGAMPVAVKGKTIRVSPFIEKGLNLDYDGDLILTMAIVKRVKPQAEQKNVSNWIYGLDQEPMEEHCEEQDEGRWWSVREIGDVMYAKIKTLVPVRSNEQVCFVDLADFPHNHQIGEQKTRNFFSVNGIQVLTFDKDEKEFVWADVSCWSHHTGCEIEIVKLESGKEIHTDNDPRAVYGVDNETLEFLRRTPSDAVKNRTWVPIGHDISSLQFDISTTVGPNDNNITLTESLGRLFGTMVGDGWVDCKDYVGLSALQGDIALGWRNDLSEIYNVKTVHTYSRKRDLDNQKSGFSDSIKHVINDKKLGKWFKFFIGQSAENKHLPPFFLRTSQEFRLGLLAGLMQTDGCISISHAEAKNKPQWMINFSTSSNRLAREVCLLFKTFGIRASINASDRKGKKRAYVVTPSLVDLHSLGRLPVSDMAALKLWDQYFKSTVNSTSSSYVRTDKVPLPVLIGARLKKLYRTDSSTWTTLQNVIKNKNGLSRAMATKILNEHPELSADAEIEYEEQLAEVSKKDFDDESFFQDIEKIGLFKRWIDMITNTAVRWDRVVSYEKTGIVQDGYDLTVPGYETFMNVEGVIHSNTLQIHAPITPGGIQDAHKMLMSNQLLADQKRNQLMAFPQHEAILGVAHATSAVATGPVKTFASSAEVEAAYRKGDLKLTDSVKIEKP